MKQLAYHKNSQDSEASCGEDDSIKTADPRPPQEQRPFRWDHDIHRFCNHMKLTELSVNQPETCELCKYYEIFSYLSVNESET